MELITETPENIEELVKQAANKTSWKVRLQAVEELQKYDCQKSRDVLTRLALHDRVFQVKESALRATQPLGITINGKPLFLGKKDTGYSERDIKRVFLRVKRECKMEQFDLGIFKEKFLIVDPEMFDVMNYEKKNNFEKWIENKYVSLPK